MGKPKKKLKKQVKKLKKKVKALKAELKGQPALPAVSPLAPKTGFPTFPEIGGVTFAAGAAGVKYQGRDDVMLAHIAPNSAVAGVFTRSATRSSPVRDCQAKLTQLQQTETVPTALGVVVNSGNSNAFTGKAGDTSVEAVCATAATALNTSAANILTSSTGVIGEPLPHDRNHRHSEQPVRKPVPRIRPRRRLCNHDNRHLPQRRHRNGRG